MPQLARIAIKHGVDNNLATLKRILEERVRAVSTTNEPSARSPATGGTPEAANLTLADSSAKGSMIENPIIEVRPRPTPPISPAASEQTTARKARQDEPATARKRRRHTDHVVGNRQHHRPSPACNRGRRGRDRQTVKREGTSVAPLLRLTPPTSNSAEATAGGGGLQVQAL
jgi:hypothetical protein